MEGSYIADKTKNLYFLFGPIQRQFANLWQHKIRFAYLIAQIQELSWFKLVFKDSDIWECEFLLQFHHWGIWYISACFLLLQNEGNDGSYSIELLLSLKRIIPAKYLARYLGECIWVAASSSTTHPSHCTQPAIPHLCIDTHGSFFVEIITIMHMPETMSTQLPNFCSGTIFWP